MRRTKIISTIGPSTDSRQTISKLIRSGMNIARINMAHTHDYEALNQKIDLIRAESKKQKMEFCNSMMSAMMDFIEK